MAGKALRQARRKDGAASPARDFDFVLASPVGRLGVRLDGAAVTRIDFLGENAGTLAPATPAARRAAAALRAYFARGGTIDLPIRPSGTAFQQRVWRALRRIPAGRTLTYGELARRLATSPRAVGNACRANPVPLVVPCHRVVAAGGIGGFAGRTDGPEVARKRWLLRHESA